MNLSYLALLAIPIVSELNHLGGQSVDIPNPRIVCRVLLIPLALALITLLSGYSPESSAILWAIYTGGFALWAVFKWGPMFMAVNGTDCRDYTTKWYQTNTYITPLCDVFVGTNQLSKLTPAQCKEWGTVYGTIRGGFLYPLFMVLGCIMTVWALPIGFLCFFQGFIYRTSSDVLHAEYKFGALIGLMFAAILMISSN